MSGTPGSSEAAERIAAVALAFVEGVGCVGYRERVGRFGSAAAAFAETVPLPQRDSALRRAVSVLDAGERAGARVLILGDREYPESLLDLADPPSFLFALGKLEALRLPGVAVVGTRRATPAGERTAYRFGGAVTRAGACLVSGMARGIDAAAHRGALDAGGLTIAVLGGGVDVPYPTNHRALYDAILAQGAVLSEAVPGSRPVAGAFPRRNRIIAALGRAVVVIEAGRRSGATLTTNAATDIGRPIGAVPGGIDLPQCIGSNELIRQGATLIASADDALLLAGLSARPPMAGPQAMDCDVIGDVDRTAAITGVEEQAVLDAVKRGAANIIDVSRLTSLPPREISAALVGLELAGALWTDHTGGIRLVQ